MTLWAWAVLWSFLTVMSYLSLKAYLRAALALLLAATVGGALLVPDWERTFIDSLFLLQHDRFDAIGAAFRRDEPKPWPWWIGLVSMSGDYEVQQYGLYLPVYEDWRAETGAGIAYLPRPPDQDTTFSTAAGDLGRPVRSFGNGWWWVE
ncbi:hypothetical protein [Microbispora corallina]|nr:hypothetical protein [Microbispora corallina]